MKIHKIFLALLFLLAVDIGCDDDDGSMQAQFHPTVCRDCPCDFDDVPMTEECWIQGSGTNVFFPNQAPLPPPHFISDNGCGLVGGPGNTDVILYVTYFNPPNTNFPNPHTCQIFVTQDACSTFLPINDDLSQGEIEACASCLEQYAAVLKEHGFPVSNGPPFKCNVPSG